MSQESLAQRMDSSEPSKKSKSKDKQKHKSEDREKKRKPDSDGQQDERHKRHKHKERKHSHMLSSTPSSALAASNANFSTTLSSSPFATRTTSFYVPLAPIAQADPLAGACAEHLSPLILTHSSALEGIVLSYSGARLSDHPYAPSTTSSTNKRSHHTHATPSQAPQYARALAAYAAPYAWLTAEFLILRVDPGVVMEGEVNVQSENHIGLICWNLFSASIERKRLPRSWRWENLSATRQGREWSEQDSGDWRWSTAESKPVRGLVKFRVVDFETKGDGFMRIEGSLLSDEEEQLLRKQGEPETAMLHRDASRR